MHSSRYPSEIPFTRRDGISRESYEAVEENSKVELFVKFRTFRPYLKKRLATIYKDGRERELKDAVEDIKYYLSVMSDMCADDNHGADTLQGFIDRIHEMIRKYPNNDSHTSSRASPSDDENDIDAERPPRSPSPTEIIDSDDPAPARPIPLEREHQGKDFSYFASLEDSLSNRSKPGASSNRDWGIGSGSETYRRRGSFQDIDMRGESRCKPMENSGSLGRGIPNNSRGWDSDIGSERGSYGHGFTADPAYRDRDERPARDYNSSGYIGSSERYMNRDREDSWRDSTNNWNSSGQEINSSRRNEDSERPRGREPEEYRYPRDERLSYEERASSWDRPYQRSSSYSRDTSSVRELDTSRNQEEPLYERRPQFERRPNQPGSNRDPDESVQIDYNHGGGAVNQTWDAIGSVSNSRDKDMRGTIDPMLNGTGILGTNPTNPAHQRFLEIVNTTAMLHCANNPQLFATPPVPEERLPPLPLIHPMFRIRPTVHNDRSVVNNRPGLLPTPSRPMPNQDFGFRNPDSQSLRATRPQAAENVLPFNPGNDTSMNSDPSSSNLFNAIKNKAAQHFSRPSARIDNQNVPPIPRSQTTSLPPPNRTSQDLGVASNQLRSNYDPRVHGLKKMNPTNHPSQNDLAQQQKASNERSKVAEPRRAENVDNQQNSKSKDENHQRSPSMEPLNRPGFAPLDPRRRNVRPEPAVTVALDPPPPAHTGLARLADIAPLDPRRHRLERAHAFQNRDRDRNATTDIGGAAKSREEIRDRNSRTVYEESQSSSKNLDEIRDRVRANMNSSTLKPITKTSKLQEIRKQVEREGFHALGRQTSKKSISSFDEAINAPFEMSPPRTIAKPSGKSKSRDSSAEKVDQHFSAQKSPKDKNRDCHSKKSAGNKQKLRETEKQDTRNEAKHRSKSNKHKQSNHNFTSGDIARSTTPVSMFNHTPKTPKSYRIPKIKKPDPIPTPAPIETPHPDIIPQIEDVPENSHVMTASKSCEVLPVTDDIMVTSNSEANGRARDIGTEELVKQFIRREVDATEAENIIKNANAFKEVMDVMIKKLQQTASDLQASEASTNIETVAEQPSQVPTSDVPKNAELNEPGTHRSRSTTRKKSAKRRSSLEKLHDALQEMGFDENLPLGPRKCTVSQVSAPKQNEVAAVSVGSESNKQTKASKKPQIVLNKEDLNQILAKTKIKNLQPSSSENPLDAESNMIVENEIVMDAGPSDAVIPVPGRRGRKRKRKGSKLKPNKKKKGPVTRAQAAVKTALKHQQKDKVKPNSPESIDDLNKSTINQDKGGSKTEGRVTRSMRDKTGLKANLGLGRIKLEIDCIPKIEPEDQDINDFLNDENLENLTKESENQPTFIEYPPCIVLEADEEDRMSIDIKNEPDCDSSVQQDMNLQKSEESVPIVTEPEPQNVVPPEVVKTEPEELEPDTDYGTDWSFLPTIPVISSTYSLKPVFEKETLEAFLDKVKEDPDDEMPETEHLRTERDPYEDDPQYSELLNWIVSTVEYEMDDSFKQDFESNLDLLSTTSFINSLETSSLDIMFGLNVSDDEELDEPNDYFINVDASDDDEEYESNEQTESEVEETIETPSIDQIKNTMLTTLTAEKKKVIASLRNNEKSILLPQIHHLLTDYTALALIRSQLQAVSRIGDDYELNTLFQGFVSPSTVEMPQQKREADELSKVGPLRHGTRSKTIKNLKTYEEMMCTEKLVHLFKCMGTYCSYSTDCKEEFLVHLMSHYKMEINEDNSDDISACTRTMPYQDIKLLKDWNACSYCSLSYKSPENLRDHIISQHSQSVFQCGYCFYRAYYHRYVVRHCEHMHINKRCNIIKCSRKSESDFIEANRFRIYVYKCALPPCKDVNNRFIFRHDFINHLKMCSPLSTSYPCHLCPAELPAELLIEHYKEHSLFKFHCSYCKYASEEKEDLDYHFYKLHPNVSGRVFSRESTVDILVEDSTLSSVKPEPVTAIETDLKSIKIEPPTPMKISENPMEENSSRTETCEVKSVTEDITSESEDFDSLMDTNNTEDLGEQSKEEDTTQSRVDRVNAIKLYSIKQQIKEEASTFDTENNRVTNLEGQELYRCANHPCCFMGVNATIFKDHAVTCIFAPENKQVSCFHCDKRLKAIPSLLEHLKVHGRRKQMCSLCSFKTWIHSELTRHMKTTHKVHNYKVEKIEVEGDEEPDVIVFPKEVACRIISLATLKENFSRYADRLVFGPDEIDKVPARHIFQSLAYCSLCSYSTKVRVNIIRHLKQHNLIDHSDEHPIPESDPVNPVPCLERKELMFDKMTNWAGSTHAHKPNTTASTDTEAVPEFVLEQFRYVCSVSSCKQITTDENMLKAHMRALHSQVDIYRCPHCYKKDATRKDVRNTVPVDQLGTHLKLHGGKLYRCTYCDFIHPLPTGMEDHLPTSHPEKKPIHYLIRNVDANGILITRMDDENAAASGKWRCNVCNTKNLFASYAEVKTHGRVNHRVFGQFICAYCRYFTDSDTCMKNHVVESCREKISDEGQILIMWVRNEFADAVKSEDIFHGPLWKRSSHNVKHIRGIFLEDVKESVRSSPGTWNSSGSGFNVSATMKGNKSIGKSLNSATAPPKSQTITSGTAQSSTSNPQMLMVCPKCNRYKTKNRQDMTVHLFNELGYQRYGCPKCTLKFVTENSLKGHYSGDHGLIYDEKLCQLLPVDQDIEDFIQEYYAEQDELAKPSEINEVKTVDGQFLCKHCGHPCNSYHNLKTHILAKHIASDRYKCNYCSQSFYSEGLANNHIKKSHPDLSLALTVDAELQNKFTPEFWMTEYGIPTKKAPEKKQFMLSPMKTGFMDASGMYRCPHCNFTNSDFAVVDLHVEEYHNEENNVSSVSSNSYDTNAVGNNGSPNFDFLDAYLANTQGTGEALPGANFIRKETANVYKCFHCLEACFTVRGARSHWKKVHFKNPEERCIYYEFKAFNGDMKLPPGMELLCGFCDYKVSSMIYMQTHHQTNHPGDAYRLKRRNRIGTKIFICDYCFHESSQVAQLQEHYDIKHPGTEMGYSIVDAKSVERSENVEYFGKLIEDAVRFSCQICQKEFNLRQDCKNHQKSWHQATKEPFLKYSRKVLNPRVKVPTDSDDDEKPKFKCPSCNFTSDDRHKLVTDHLPIHLASYLCPLCSSSFTTFVETTFHIRHSHADPNNNPVINRQMSEERANLEKQVVEVGVKTRRKRGHSTKPISTDPQKRRTVSVTNNHSFGAIKTENVEDDDDDVVIEDVIILNPNTKNLPSLYGRENGKVKLKKRVPELPDEPEASTSSKYSEGKNVISTWNFLDDCNREYYRIKSPTGDDNEDEPDIIEIPSGSTGIHWDIDGIPEFSRLSDGDPFINPSSYNWEEWEGRD